MRPEHKKGDDGNRDEFGWADAEHIEMLGPAPAVGAGPRWNGQFSAELLGPIDPIEFG
jgi:hypothetical protein